MSPKQKEIVKYLTDHETIDFATVRSLIDDYYHNGAKHTSDVMARMIKQRMIIRVKKGVYALNKTYSHGNVAKAYNNPNQLSIPE
jgi:hypothetical protein